MNGAIQVPSPTAIIKGSPHPNAAKLFAQFNLLPEIQHKFTEEGHHSPRLDVPPPPGVPGLDQVTLYPDRLRLHREEHQADQGEVRGDFSVGAAQIPIALSCASG